MSDRAEADAGHRPTLLDEPPGPQLPHSWAVADEGHAANNPAPTPSPDTVTLASSRSPQPLDTRLAVDTRSMTVEEFWEEALERGRQQPSSEITLLVPSLRPRTKG